MTKQSTQATVATATRARTYYGITAKDFLAIASTKTNPAEVADMLTFVRKRITDHAAKHPSRVARWKRVEAALLAKAGVPVPAAKPARSPKAKGAAKPADAVSAALAAFGGDAQALLLALAARV